ncbi:MAG: enoyl-CoA hydratase/isomerase family protein [Alphaproteobacteria bacterium]|nr:enoyl-CoA hydratase/isomerase family protein [Alphaproteobacteria bacterium]MBU1515149.1 enoyl-CoA hydratase/isomerase family protein [Alphaproteobacteria bacterium]MBU2092279.1 enoyl-CoA hydratase/isomerase family protein [Alphaproteobacteria bacterium]MBU2152873.1 enoyl-CoA hydratase/isomerase family protein [Alphaproteobacteria bacterium]MBU2305704.1 enoyl-CoA hydratase/isomerase family protein [Alphaproteobacteria bacterium]
MSAAAYFTVDRTTPGVWRATFSNPPINLLPPAAILELQDLITAVEAEPSVNVLVFDSADPDFFIAHFETAKSAEMPREAGPSGHSPWIDVVVRLSRSPVISLAKIRGRTRGVGSEFVLACDMRFASRQRAILGQPEVGVGLPPGGGALEWLPRLVGRSRALEIVLSGDDFDAEVAERYGWINRAVDDDQLDSFVEDLARRLASFDRETLGALKALVNRVGVPDGDAIEASNQAFFAGLNHPAALVRRDGLGALGYGQRSDFELNFGRRLADLQPDHSAG